MADKNALTELAVDMQVIRDGTVNPAYGKSADKAMRIVAEFAKYNINLIPQECYGCGVLKLLAKCRAIAEEGAKA